MVSALVETDAARFARVAGLAVATLRRLSQAALERPAANGWPLKVHIVHLADWNLAAAARLEGAHPADALGVPRRLWLAGEEERINRLLANLARDLPPSECIRRYAASSSRLTAALAIQGMISVAGKQPLPLGPRHLPPAPDLAGFGAAHLAAHLADMTRAPDDRRAALHPGAWRRPSASA